MVAAADENKRASRHAATAAADNATVIRPSPRVLHVSTTFLLLLLSIPLLLYATTDAGLLVSHGETFLSPAPANRSPTWAENDVPTNYTSALLAQWLAPGGSPCRDALTADVAIRGLDGGARLAAGRSHEFLVQAVDEQGTPRCLGGDYFEASLAGARWRSRPPMRDRGDGTYSLTLQVNPRFAGAYNFTLVLLFRRHEGLKISTEKHAYERELRRVAVEFHEPEEEKDANLPELRECGAGDWARAAWAGRWTRHAWSGDAGRDYCEVDAEGRYRCLEPGARCDEPWCFGPLAALESSGWVYSAHCSFRLFTQQEAWSCLSDKWLFFWGDSNHVDTIRNLLNFVLGRPEIRSVPRRFDRNFSDPSDPARQVRITSVFNGHWNESLNYLGLDSLSHPAFRALIRDLLPRPPDFMLLNSGLHDGIRWRSVRAFAHAADAAVGFFEELLRGWEGTPTPTIFYRTSVATGGHARRMAFNPSKMEAFNGVMVEKMRALTERGGGGVIDHFDMTFPWHFDNRCSDGVHYGRAPARARWRDGEIGHHYFVDLMLGHVLLNSMCNRPRSGGNRLQLADKMR